MDSKLKYNANQAQLKFIAIQSLAYMQNLTYCNVCMCILRVMSIPNMDESMNYNNLPAYAIATYVRM